MMHTTPTFSASLPSRHVRALALTVTMVFAVPAVCAPGDVYVSHTKNGVPVYSQRKDNTEAKLVLQYREPEARRRGKAPDYNPLYAPWNPGPAFTAPSLKNVPTVLLSAVERAAVRHGFEPALLIAIIEVESRFVFDAKSPAGAMGLMQLTAATARRYGVLNPWDPEANIDGGSRYLRDLVNEFGGDLRLALAGYNAGEGAVRRHGGTVPPYAETLTYVPKVLARYRAWRNTLRDWQASASTWSMPAESIADTSSTLASRSATHD